MEHTPAQKKQGTTFQFNLRMCIKIQVLAKKQFIPHSYHILTSSVIYYRTDARQLGIYLFYIIKN